jgi:hypothetical protein
MFALIDLHKNPRSLRIGDMAFFEAKVVDGKTLDSCGRWLADQEWFRQMCHGCDFANMPNFDGRDSIISEMCMQRLKGKYASARKRNQNPDWLEALPPEFIRMLEYNYLACEAESPDAYKIIPSLPHTGFGFVVFEDGLVIETDDAFGLGRLNNVRQLGSLHDPTITGGEWRQLPQAFTHTRYEHSLDVCALATLIGQRCGLSENDFYTLRIAAQSHDGLTPAGGDSIKVIDPDAFDEDAHYPEFFWLASWKKLRDRYGISESKLAEVILDRGFLGTILDVSDKLGYTGRDLQWFLYNNPAGHQAWENFAELYDRITSILKANPYPCSVWDCAESREGELVFTDEERFADFLRMRALMFKILYANASARFYEAGFVAEVAKVLYQDKVLTRNLLLKIGDMELFEIMGGALGTSGERVMSLMPSSEDPRVETFPTIEEALDLEREIAKAEPETMTHLGVAQKPSTSCLDKFKVIHNGKALPFSQACPFHTWDIKQIFHDRKPFWVFMYNLDKLCRNKKMKSRLLQSRNKRIAT